MIRHLVLIAIMTFILAPACAEPPRLRPDNWATPVMSEQLDNWYKVDERVYRSAQPDEDAMDDLKAMGISRILTLRNFHDDEDDAEGTGLQLNAAVTRRLSRR